MDRNLVLIAYQVLFTYSVIFHLFVPINGTISPMNYAYTQTEQCGNRTSLFLSFRGVSLGWCLTECGKRSKCVAINYRKRYDNLCELLADNSFVSKVDDCMYIRRNEMDFSGSVVESCTCSVGLTCNLDTGTCSKTECDPIDLNNGKLIGNRYSIGSSLRVKCNTDYREENNVTTITCLSTGYWSSVPSCVLKECQPFTVDNGLTSGNDFRIGASLTVSCNTDYEEENSVTMVTCLSSSVWDYTPNCVLKPCTSEWVQLDNSCYYISDGSVSRNSAKNRCEQKGGTLAKLDTSSKTNFIIYEISGLTSSADSYWILLKKSNNVWYWETGVQLTGYTDWGYNQPETKGEKCVYLWGPDSYRWHDATCGWGANYICEKPTYS